MIAVELIRRSRSADAIGPCGSRTPWEQAPSVTVATRTSASTAYRISDHASCAYVTATVRDRPRRAKQPEVAGELSDQAHLGAPSECGHLPWGRRIGPAAIEVFAQVFTSYADPSQPPRGHKDTRNEKQTGAIHLTDQRAPTVLELAFTNA